MARKLRLLALAAVLAAGFSGCYVHSGGYHHHGERFDHHHQGYSHHWGGR